MNPSLIRTDDLSVQQIETLFADARVFQDGKFYDFLQDKLIITLFFENSTRTRSSFEIAAKRLRATVVHLDISKSSTKKGETLLDTAANLDAMGPHALIVRHETAGVPGNIANHVNASVINAGDGAHAHPSQALLDLFTITEHFKGDIKGKHIAITGDIKNSRVASSNIELLQRFGLKVTLVAPPHYMPDITIDKTHNLKEIIDSVDIIMSLRTQTERHNQQVYASLEEYALDYCITEELLGDRDILILHPGPVHRNIDISDAVLADPRCKVLQQVSNGVVIRMAILKMLLCS